MDISKIGGFIITNKLEEIIKKCSNLTQDGCFKCQCTPVECIKNLYAVANGYDYDLVEEMFNNFEDDGKQTKRR